MKEKKIVSIEDRIPKLKEARKKKANRRLILYLSFFFILILLILYLQSSLSNVHNITVNGNEHVNDQDVIQMSGVSSKDNFWKVNGGEVASKIEQHEEIKSVQVDKQLPASITFEIEEYDRVGYVQNDGSYYPILSTGDPLSSLELKSPAGDAPLLIGWDKPSYLEEMTQELQQLPQSVTQLISEIHWTPTDKNPYKVHLYMNDGYEVEGSIRSFSDKMKSYPSIVSQLDSSKKGIIHIDVGAYFEEYSSDEEEEGEKDDEKVG
ncbi:cell division protein FtsQ/DivIB [Pontibacillus salicampi]|uniref:Cell division protein DivIB n=1 Tax=Pontibacillus salicampi TaxID=1449801 RepID=A0ABV6LNT8_9BACI